VQSDPATTPSPEPSTAGAPGSHSGRVLAVDVFAEPLGEQIPPGETVVEGDPRAAVSVLGEVGTTAEDSTENSTAADTQISSPAGAEVGVWEMTPGAATDVEADEIFVVLSGRATLGFDGGETLELRPGVVVRLLEGDRTTWTVHETIRKVYVTPATPAP
jgi:uncharacterized protein